MTGRVHQICVDSRVSQSSIFLCLKADETNTTECVIAHSASVRTPRLRKVTQPKPTKTNPVRSVGDRRPETSSNTNPVKSPATRLVSTTGLRHGRFLLEVVDDDVVQGF